ncbi:hypothetical protein CSUI_005503 [Cystoisospora suis]|uniref:Transmembrane protein n=1 Tax=Cystoisospora suis TaxID=483139 RepID=A0A2C6KUZ4_9APIC|nr:hypothetical protein CSUI_005503 [Cystoisospora suis]
MGPVAAATSPPAAAGVAPEKPGRTMDMATGGGVLEGWPLEVNDTERGEEGADRRYTGERPRSDSSRLRRPPRHRRLGKPFGFAHVAVVLAIAIGFVIAMSALHRMTWCLRDALRQKRSVDSSTGVSSRRLASGEGDTQLPHLPSYEEATSSPSFSASWGPNDAPWDPTSGELGAPPQYSGPDQAAPPPRYEEVCATGVWTVSGRGAQPQSGVVTRRSIWFAYRYELIVAAVWLLSAAGSILLGNFTSLSWTVSGSVGAALAVLGTVVVISAASKLERFRSLLRQSAAGPVDV